MSVDADATALGTIAKIIAASLDATNANDDVAFLTTDAGTELGALINAAGGLNFSLPPNMPAALAGGAANPLAIAVGDFDNAGTLDLYVSHNTGGAESDVSVYGNAGANDGDLSTLITGPTNLGSNNPVDVIAAEFDGNALTDVGMACNLSGDAVVAPATGAGFGAASSVALGGALGPVALVAADFDGTGGTFLDIAAVNGSSLQILLNAAGAFGAPTSTPIANSPEVLAVGDFDGVNGPDIVVGNTAVDQILVFLNNGAGVFAQSGQGNIAVVGTAPFTIVDVEVGNFDGTGNPDIAVLLDSDEIVFFLNDQGAAGTFAASSNSPVALTGAGAVDMAVFDFDTGAGFDDLAVAETGAGGQIEVVQTS